MRNETLSVLCDGHRLSAGATVAEHPKGLVLLLHGIPSTSPPAPGDTGYPGLAERFAEAGWTAAWVDMRSVRGSQGDFSIEGWVRDARAALDAARTLDGAAGLPVAVVGSSAGGAVGAELVRRGAPVRSLVLLAAPAQWVSFAGHPQEGVRRITEEAGMTLSAEALADPTAWAAEFDRVTTEEAIASVHIPTLIVHGTADDVVPVEHARRIAARAPSASLEILEGAGHQLRREPGVVELVLEWLDRVIHR